MLGFASTPLVGLMAERSGFEQSYAALAPPAEAVRNARALENSLLLLILVATAAKFVVGTGAPTECAQSLVRRRSCWAPRAAGWCQKLTVSTR